MFCFAILFSVIRTRGKIINEQEISFSKVSHSPWAKSLNLRALAAFCPPGAHGGFFASWPQGWESPRLSELWRHKRNPQALRWIQDSRFCSISFSLDILMVAHLENINVRWIWVGPWKTCLFRGNPTTWIIQSTAWIHPQRIPKAGIYPNPHNLGFKGASVYTVFGSDVTFRVRFSPQSLVISRVLYQSLRTCILH